MNFAIPREGSMRASWPHYVTAIMRTTAGINKAEEAGRMDAQISSTDALRRVLPTTVSSYLQFRGWTPRRPCVTGVHQHLI